MLSLKILLIILWIFGTFPSKTPLLSSSSFRFKWLSLPALYSLGTTILGHLSLNFALKSAHATYRVDSFTRNASVNYKMLLRDSSVSDSFSETLVKSLVLNIWLGAFLGIRIFGLFNCSTLVHLLKAIQEFETKGHTPLIKKLVILFAFTFFLGISHWVYDQTRFWPFFSSTPQLQTIHLIALGIFQLFYFVSTNGATLLLHLLAIKLIRAYSTFVHDLKMQLESSGKNHISTILKDSQFEHNCPTPGEMEDRFYQLKKAFRAFNESTGDKIFFLISSSVGICLQSLYEFIVLTGSGFSIGAFSSVVIIFYLAYLGNGIETFMEREKEELSNVLRKAQICRDEKIGKDQCNLERVAEDLLAWNWRYKSFNFLSINFNLLPKIMGGLLTYLIFIFEMRKAERRF